MKGDVFLVMTNKHGYLLMVPIILGLLVVQGCGKTNFFRQIGLASGNGASSVSNLESILDSAGPGNPAKYTEVISAADAIINSSSSTTADRQKAYAYKGEALLGKNGITVTEIVSNLNNVGTNPLDAFNLSSASANEIAAAAVALNAASSQGDLSSDQQMTRAIANAAAISTKVNEVFSVTNNAVSVKGGASAESALSQLVGGGSGSDDGLTDFASALADSVADLSGLDDEQKGTVTDISDKAEDATDLNGAVASRDTSYQVGNTAYDFSNESTRSSNITNALSSIFFGN